MCDGRAGGKCDHYWATLRDASNDFDLLTNGVGHRQIAAVYQNCDNVIVFTIMTLLNKDIGLPHQRA